MGNDRATAEKLQQFLRDLTPEHRTKLIAGLERSLLLGDGVPGCELVLRELRRVLHESGNPTPRIGNAARMFFTPFEPFIVDDAASQKHPGRISRAALTPIWQWIGRDFMAEEAAVLSVAVKAALLANNRAEATTLTHAFQDQFVARLQAAVTALADDERVRWRFFAKISTPRATDDVEVLLQVLKGRDRLAALARRLPDHIGNLADGSLDSAQAAIDTAVKGQPRLYIYAILVLMNRLAAPWQAVRLAIRAARSDSAVLVAETPYAMAVAITLYDLERMIRELRTQLRGGRGVAVTGLLKAVHDTTRGLRTELALPVESPWGHQFGAVRTQISELLKSELEGASGVVRRLLRARPSGEMTKGAMLDPGDVAQATAVVDLVVACRAFAGELAINELSRRTYMELQQYLDAAARGLRDGVRNAAEADRWFLQSQYDVAVGFCEKVFDFGYATALTKAAPGSDRKVARG